MPECPKCGAECRVNAHKVLGYECGSQWINGVRAYESAACLRRQLAQAQAVIDKLPKTVDGVAVVLGMRLYLPQASGACEWDDVSAIMQGSWRGTRNTGTWFGFNKVYSTRKAAAAAKNKDAPAKNLTKP